jgi:DNA-binding MarR family transcriptional regulator
MKTMETRAPQDDPIASYLDEPPPRGLFTRLARVALHMARLQEESMRAIDLRFADYTVLATLRKEGAKDGLPVSRLAELVLRPMGSITQVVDRLEKLDLVRRKPDPRDRRMVLIAITEEGERVALHGASVYDENHARVVEEMDPEELDQVDRGIRRLLNALENDLAGVSRE